MFRVSRWLMAALFVAAVTSPGGLAAAKAQGGRAAPTIDPTHITYTLPDHIKWTPLLEGAQSAVLVGDPSKPGWYVMLVRWMPHHFSRPHFHPHDRYVTVLSGTWWVSSSDKYDPDATVPMPAGSFVTDLAKQVHWDGAKNEPVTLEIVGEGPATMTRADKP
jgi:quercetin dioxygenase-like cupin family protein